MKHATLPDFLTDAQIMQCIDLFPSRQAIRDLIIIPNLETINRKLGQENDADYLAYAIVYVLGSAFPDNGSKTKEAN